MLALSPSGRRTEAPLSTASPAAQVVVLGMHRSGTSALTGLLRLLGLWAGEEDDFPPPDGHNQAGYWEHRGVWSVDEAILRRLGASWSRIADLDLSRLGPESRARFVERAREIVEDLDRHGPWVVKDPRLCLLFPVWREILAHPFCVLIYREPLPVARSLAARDGFPIPYGIALWEEHMRQALASTRGLPRVLISHRELMTDPAAVLRDLHRRLGELGDPQLARLRFPTDEEIRAVVDPALVHHPHEPEIERLYLTPPQLGLLEALADGTALDLDPAPPLSPGARDLLAGHHSLPAGPASGTDDLHHALSWLDQLDALFSAVLESRSWRIGRAVTSAIGRLLGRSETSAPEKRDRLMAEVRRWRNDHAGD
jgi:O-antigen biosynthesis protein